MAVPIVCDFTKAKEANDMLGKAISEPGKIDISVNHAGCGKRKQLVRLPGSRFIKLTESRFSISMFPSAMKNGTMYSMLI
jgi:NAD(P)-dependent dehydrogenase (short-subunit alcohol dehydrogenase family)